MTRWMTKSGGRIVAILGAACVLSLAACGTVRGVGEDLSSVSDSTRMAIFGGNPDGAPVD